MGLDEYGAKRQFGKTPEPGPVPGAKGDHLVFVVPMPAALILGEWPDLAVHRRPPGPPAWLDR
jgi:hypothetical protein